MHELVVREVSLPLEPHPYSCPKQLSWKELIWKALLEKGVLATTQGVVREVALPVPADEEHRSRQDFEQVRPGPPAAAPRLTG